MYDPLLTRLYIYIYFFFFFCIFKPKFRENSIRIKIGFCFCLFSDDAKIVSQSGRLEGEWPKIVQRPARKKVGNGRDESHWCGAYPRASDDKVR